VGDKTAIEWTDATWNPVTGCDQVSEGRGLPRPDDTTHGTCYALTLAARLKVMGNPRYQRDGDPRTSGPGFGVTLHEDQLDLPLRWRKPRRVFANSMSDLFHDQVPDEFIARMFGVMALARRHTFQVLTKRPGRMASLLGRDTFELAARAEMHRQKWAAPQGLEAQGWSWPLPNVWLGVSVESQKWADVRVPPLLRTPAAFHFISAEPLLDYVDLADWICPGWPDCDPPSGDYCNTCTPEKVGGSPINWVIVGGESGPGARPMGPDWARDLRDQCEDGGIAFFFKQWGEWVPAADLDPDLRERAPEVLAGQEYVCRVGKKRAGRLLDGRTWDEYPR
jgi:protein gp37